MVYCPRCRQQRAQVRCAAHADLESRSHARPRGWHRASTESRLDPLQDSKAVQALEEKTHVATLIAFSRYEIGRLHEIRGALQKEKQRPQGFVPERANIAGWNQRLDVQERVRVH